jgi:hypothetical protein
VPAAPTVGAPLRWVTPCSLINRQITSPRTSRRQMWVPPIAVTAHGVHQPLQWNIGSVHRYTESGVCAECTISDSEFRLAPRWVYITPLGRPVVPEV